MEYRSQRRAHGKRGHLRACLTARSNESNIDAAEKAADLVERMEREGLIGPANNVGKREILLAGRDTESVAAAMR